MKCTSCGGKLEGPMNFCPFCGVRQDVDLRQIHYRNLGENAALPCPECAVSLEVIEFEVEPPVQIERCGTCHGMFFNPGELQVLLHGLTNPLVWFDPVQIQQIAEDFAGPSRITYKKCPMCHDVMNRINFGGRSGVILDSCGFHGLWAESSELRRLAEWWRAGGKLVYQQNELQKVKNLYDPVYRNGHIHLPDSSEDAKTNFPIPMVDLGSVVGCLADTIYSILD